MLQLQEHYEKKIQEKKELIAVKDAEIKELNEFKEQRDAILEKKNLWQQNVRSQKVAHQAILDSIEKDKIKQIDDLRKEMLLQIRAVKVKMLNMNEDQLVGTTKLTVIQNAQLTGELEYQSMQTEHLMYKNHQMTGIIQNLQKDLADHKEVENELAKRSHFCQKVI